MKIYEIAVSVKLNMGSYESESYDLKAQLAEGEDAVKSLKDLKSLCLTAAGRLAGKVEESVKVEEEKKPLEKKAPKAKEKVAVEAPKVEEVTTVTVNASPNTASSGVVVASLPLAAVAPKKTVKAKANVAYDRANDKHKDLLGRHLDSLLPGWRNTHATKAAEASKSLIGTDFLDGATGDILDSFKQLLASKIGLA